MKVLVQRNPIFSRCPECKAVGSIHRSRARGTWQQFVRNLLFSICIDAKNVLGEDINRIL